MLDLILFLPFILIAFFILYQSGRLFANRYLRSYHNEIAEYLRKKHLSLQEVYYPNSRDWEGSPFQKPKLIKYSFLIIRFFGFYTSWSKDEYRVIVATDSKERPRIIWLRVNTTFFSSPNLTFKEGKTKKQKTIKPENVITNFDHCPACNYALDRSNNVCPDCGLHFT